MAAGVGRGESLIDCRVPLLLILRASGRDDNYEWTLSLLLHYHNGAAMLSRAWHATGERGSTWKSATQNAHQSVNAQKGNRGKMHGRGPPYPAGYAAVKMRCIPLSSLPRHARHDAM